MVRPTGPPGHKVPAARVPDPLEALAGNLAASEERHRTLFETMPLGIVHYDADGSVTGANRAASDIFGMDVGAARTWPVVPPGQAVREDGSPFPPEEQPVVVALRTGRVVTDVVGVRSASTEDFRWVLATVVPDARDADGRPSRAYAVFSDLTERRRTEAALEQSTALLGRLSEANVLGVVVAGEDRVYEANDAYLGIIGYSREDLEAGRLTRAVLNPPDWAPAEDRALRQLLGTGACQPYEKEYVHKDGHRVPVLIGSAVIGQSPLRWTAFVIDLSARERAERERAALRARERVNRAEAEIAHERLTFLMRAGSLVAATRDRDELLDQITRLVVPSLGDYCVVYLPTADGKLLATAIHHRSQSRTRQLGALRQCPVSPAGPLVVQRAYTSGSTAWSRDVIADMRNWADEPEPNVTAIVKLMRPGSRIATPLLSPGGPVGVIVLGRGARRARFTETDVAVIEELGRRLAAGLVNTDAFAREHAIAETLQRSLLPDGLPDVPGLDIAVRYLPATEGADVGGDWYDAFPVPGGRIGLVIGDVAGHSIASASVMGQVRSLLRAYAIDDPAPARVLERTNTALALLLPDVIASVVYAVLDPVSRELSYANAGHPPPLVAGPGGWTGYLDDTDGALLGVSAGTCFSTGRRVLGKGSRLVLYTDGLIEDRRRDITDGLAILAGTLRGAGPVSAGQTCATVEEALLGTATRSDDVCLLTARLAG